MRTAVVPGRSQITSAIAPMLASSPTVTAPITRARAADCHPVAERRHLMRALVPDQHAGVNRAVGVVRQAGVNQPPARRVNPQPGAMLVEAGISMLVPACASMQYAGYKRQQHRPGRAPHGLPETRGGDRPRGASRARWSGAAARLQRPFRYQSFIRGMALIRFQPAAAGSRDAREDLIRLRGGRRRAAPSRTYGARRASARADARARGRSPRTSSDRGWPPGPVRGGRLTSG